MRGTKLWIGVVMAALVLAACGDDAGPDNTADPPNNDTPDASPEDTPEPEPEQDASEPEDVPDEEVEQSVDLEAPLAEQNEFGPAGRLVSMLMPETPEAARREGCIIFGEKVGTGLNSLLLLAGGLEPFLVPGPDGQIALLMLTRVMGWSPGEGSGALQEVDLFLYQGLVGDEGQFLIRQDAFIDNDPEAGSLISFPNTPVDGGWIETQPGDFFITVPFLGIPISLNLVGTRITGQLFADGPGAGMDKGVLTGYVDDKGAIELIGDIQRGCASDTPPAICGAIDNVFPLDEPPEAALDTVVAFAGGYDTRITDGHPYPCDPEDEDPEVACNAIGMCILVEMGGVEIGGIADGD